MSLISFDDAPQPGVLPPAPYHPPAAVPPVELILSIFPSLDTETCEAILAACGGNAEVAILMLTEDQGSESADVQALQMEADAEYARALDAEAAAEAAAIAAPTPALAATSPAQQRPLSARTGIDTAALRANVTKLFSRRRGQGLGSSMETRLLDRSDTSSDTPTNDFAPLLAAPIPASQAVHELPPQRASAYEVRPHGASPSQYESRLSRARASNATRLSSATSTRMQQAA